MGTITLTARDRSILHLLADGSASSEQLASTIEDSSGLTDRLTLLVENGLLWERDDGEYALTESGSRVLETPADSSGDRRIDAPEHVREAIVERDLQPSREKAVFDAVAFLRYWGEATESELIDGIYSENPAEYETADEWWETFMRDTLAGLPDIEPPTTETDPWRYTGAEIDERTEDGRRLIDDTTASYGSVKHALEALDLTTDQQAAVHAVFVELRHHDATETELKRHIHDRVDTEGTSADEWWNQCIGPVLETLPGIERTDERTWQYTGNEIAPNTNTDTETDMKICPVCQQPYDGRVSIEANETRVSDTKIPICIKAIPVETHDTRLELYYHEPS